MKNLLPKGSAPAILFLFALAFIVNSCKKDVAVSQTTPLSQKQQIDVVNEAKTWFQKNEAINKPSVAINTAGTTRTWYDGLNPGWDNTLVYEKDKGTVIEMPLLNSAVAFLLNTTDGSKASLQTNYTKTTYLIRKDSVGVFKGWFMVLVADTAYINGDFTKLDKNTYQQRDPAYSGRLMYFDINGKFAGGWRYENGAITKTLTLTNAATTGGPQINSEKPITTMGVGGCTVTPVVTVSWICSGFDGTNHTASIRTNGVTCEPTYNVTGYILECSGGGGSTDGGGGGSYNPGTGTGGNTDFPSPIDQGCKSLAPASVDGKQVNLQPLIPTNPDDPCLVKPPVPEPPIPEDPCDKLKKAKQNLPANFNTTSTTILAKPGSHEFGADLNLTTLASNTYKLTPVTEGLTGYWQSTFTWNSTGGYTIGSMHRHQAAGPSPDDIFGMVDDRMALSQIGASATDKQFYENNAYAVILLNNTTFIATINSWGTLQAMFNDYNQDRIGYGTAFQALAAEYKSTNNVDELTATIAVLKNLFGDSINLSKAPSGTTSFAVVGIDQDGKLITKPCPQ